MSPEVIAIKQDTFNTAAAVGKLVEILVEKKVLTLADAFQILQEMGREGA